MGLTASDREEAYQGSMNQEETFFGEYQVYLENVQSSITSI